MAQNLERRLKSRATGLSAGASSRRASQPWRSRVFQRLRPSESLPKRISPAKTSFDPPAMSGRLLSSQAGPRLIADDVRRRLLNPARSLWNYLADLSIGRFVLWCYFIWWTVVLVRYFDPNPGLWLTSLGLSVIIGAALVINATVSGRGRLRLQPWPTFRFFLIPFCVSSFAALAKGQGFILIFSPRWKETAMAAGPCAALGVIVTFAKRWRARSVPSVPHEAGPAPTPRESDARIGSR